ncbi:MAG: zeta toxin family protein [Acidaminococcales bacterium]|jgi:predicted ABC-type ATPase|nr:zeta toxin family protein [Acidaminococcales bacterium]
MDKDKELYLFAGPNGSGKSTLVRQFEKNGECPETYICPDMIVQPDKRDDIGAYLAAMDKAEKQRTNEVEHGRPFAFESVMSNNGKLEFLKYAKAKGYKITVVYVTTTSPEINAERVKIRVGKGGHDVPKDKIFDRYYKSLANLPKAYELADVFYLYDNSGYAPVLVLKRSDDKTYFNPTYLSSDWANEYVIGPLALL